jgi:ABC-2 type transport system ATP-binding protein
MDSLPPSGLDRRAPAIEVSDLRRTFVTGRRRRRRQVEAVRGVSFTVDQGERLAFIGPNGAGKSTSIKMLTGLLHPTGGQARVLGLEPWTQRRELSRRIGTLFGPRSQLWAELAPRASLRTLGAIFGLDDYEIGRRVHELGLLLEATELFDQPARTLSLGQRMRCELAACMLHRPRLLFLDEPTIGLDLLAKQRFRQVLVRLNTELGTTVFLTSHDVADIEHVAQRAIVVNHGTVVTDSPVAQLRRQFLSTKRIELGLAAPVDPGTSLEAVLGPGVTIVERSEAALSLTVDTGIRPVGEVLDTVLAELDVADLSVVDPPLEHVIGALYAQSP